MASANICSKCGNKIVTGIRKYQGKYYCAHCYDQIMEEAQRFEDEKQKLVLFIKDLFMIQECPEIVLYVIEKALREGKKLSDIKGTLLYYYNIQGNAPDNISYIGTVIQREYANAAKYFEETKRIKAANEAIDINVPPVVIRIHTADQKRKKMKYRMEDL